MNLPLVFRAAAQTEFDNATGWYESQRIGFDFAVAVQKVLETIASQPDRFPVASGDVREAPVSGFPYCVYYRVKTDRVVIVAVFHASRDPAIWQSRP